MKEERKTEVEGEVHFPDGTKLNDNSQCLALKGNDFVSPAPSAPSATARRSAMPRKNAAPELRCPIGVFETSEARIRNLTERAQQSQGQEKVEAARALLDEVNRLIQCKSVDANNMNCTLCRNFSALRHKMAMLVIKRNEL